MGDSTDNRDNDVHLELVDEPAAHAGGAAQGPAVVVMREALRDAMAHAAEETNHEIGGILVGSIVSGERPTVIVEAVIRGSKMAYSRTNVTFTHETWNEINAIKD